jgi:hypothetical protein
MQRRREIELLLLAMFAALPLYATQTIAKPPLMAFHVVMSLMVARVAMGKTQDVIPAVIMRAIGVAYIMFYIVDAAMISRSAIAASTHLVLFIATYQPMEAMTRRNDAQRLLTASLLFIASLATATHIAIVPFVIVFAFLLFRQLIHVSHIDSLESAQLKAAEPPSGRAAAFYVAGTTVIGVLLFPMLPRVRNPLVPGMAGALNNASTGLSESIDFNDDRTISADAATVSRIWLSQEAVPFFTPLRLRGTIYDHFQSNRWLQSRRAPMSMPSRDGATIIATPSGFTRRATIQQRMVLGTRLFLPTGTYAVTGTPLFEGPTRDIYSSWSRGSIANYEVRLARQTFPLRQRARIVPEVTDYPVTPAVRALAQQIVGEETDPTRQAAAIEQYLSTTFRYVPDPASIGRPITVDEFLLREKRGHCEYFAAGMVALLTSLNVPARIVGGFYGGQLNPLTGYFVIRKADAHAWVEMWDGRGWATYDPTPAGLRPGNVAAGLGAYASALGDSINYFWDRYILTFGLADQIALAAEAITRVRATIGNLKNMRFEPRSFLSLRTSAVAAALLVAIFGIVWIARGRRTAFDLLREHLRSLDIDVGPAMTMEDALRLLRRRHPEAAAALLPLITLYEEESFSPRGTPARAAIRKRLQELRA